MTNTIHYPKSNYTINFLLYIGLFSSVHKQSILSSNLRERQTDTHPFLLTPRFHELITHYSNAISQEYPEGLTISAVSNSFLLFLFEPTPIRLDKSLITPLKLFLLSPMTSTLNYPAARYFNEFSNPFKQVHHSHL